MKMKKFGLNLAFTGTIKDEILDKEEIAFFLVRYLINNYLNLLIQKYSLDKEEIKNSKEKCDENEIIVNIIEQIGRKRGALISGGKVDNTKVSNIILQDFREARIGRITLEKVKE